MTLFIVVGARAWASRRSGRSIENEAVEGDDAAEAHGDRVGAQHDPVSHVPRPGDRCHVQSQVTGR
jgi:hypothetical protein